MKEVWYKADEGDWDDRLPLITAAIESGVDHVLVNEDEVGKVRELGDVGVAAFVDDADEIGEGDENPDVAVVGKNAEGDGTVEFPPDMSGSSDLTTVRRIDGEAANYVEIAGKEYERLAAAAGETADYVVVVGEDWKIIPLENLIADLQDEDARIVAGVDSAEEAKTAFETMEVGADGVLLETSPRSSNSSTQP